MKRSEMTIEELQKDVERRRLIVEQQSLQAMEGVGGFGFDWFGDYVNPAEPLFDSPDFFYPLIGENLPFNLDNRLKGELLPVYITEYGLKILRDYSRWLDAYNPYAINLRKNCIAFICGKGYGYGCTPADKDSDFPNGDRELCKIAQRILDRFMQRANWNEWEQWCVHKGVVDGESFLRFFHTGGGECVVRPIEPEHVRSPGDQSAHRSFGIETPEYDIMDVLGFWIVLNPAVTWTPYFVEGDNVVHIRNNVGATAKRGYPTLIPVRRNLIRADKLLQVMSTLASSQSTIAGIRKWDQYSASAVQAFQQQNADLTVQDPITGQNRFMKRYMPGTWIDAPKNVNYEFPATKVPAAALVDVLQAELRAIASSMGWPEFMLGSNADTANYATAMVAEAPGVKNLEVMQAFYARQWGDGIYGGPAKCGSLWRVLEYAIEWGNAPHEILDRVKIQAEPPTLVARERDKETNRNKILSDEGILSKATWSKQEGLDYDREQELGATKAMVQVPEMPYKGKDEEVPKPPSHDRRLLKKDMGESWESLIRSSLKLCEYFDSSKHPRADSGPHGGEFTKNGGSGGASTKTPKAPSEKHSRHKDAKRNFVGKIIGTAQAFKKAVTDAANRVGSAVWDRMPAKAQKAAAMALAIGKHVEHRAMTAMRKGKELATEIAIERGFSTEHATKVGQVIGTLDQISSWTVNFPVGHALTGSHLGGKVATLVPLASMAYVAYSTARNPFATIRAAKSVIGKKGSRMHESKLSGDTIAELMERLDLNGGDEWYIALVYAALDVTHNLEEAIEMADLAYAENPEGPDEN